MKTVLTHSLLIALFGLLAFGCTLDDEITSGRAFHPAFPDEDTLTIQTAGLSEQQGGLSSLSQALLGDRADLHDLSFGVAWHLNTYAHRLLATIWFITRFPPTMAVEEDGLLGDPGEEIPYNARAVWGPFADDEGKNLEFILHVWRAVDPEDDRIAFIYFVAAREQGAGDDAWVPFLVGGTKPYEGHQDRFGLIKLDMNAIRSFDPSEDDVGVFSFIFIQQADSHAVAAVAEGVWLDEDQTQTTDATYFYGRSDQGYAVLEFDADTNLEDPPGEALEHLHVSTGWLYNGDGRSDAVVSGGDLGEATGTFTECWGIDLTQTYFKFLTTGLSPDVTLEDGEVSACFTPEPIVIEDIDYEGIRTAFD